MSFGKMNRFAEIKAIEKTKDGEGFATAQEVTLVCIVVEAQQYIQNAYRLLVVVIHHRLTAHPVEICFVVLCTGAPRRENDGQSEYCSYYASTHSLYRKCLFVERI